LVNSPPAEIVVVGGTSGLGRELAQYLVRRGEAVLVTGRDSSRAKAVAAELGGQTRGLAVNLAHPQEIAGALADVAAVKHLVLAAIERDANSVRDYDVERAVRLVTLKLVGYTEVVHALVSRFAPEASVLVFGGLAKDVPYPGSTTVTTVNAGVTGIVRTLAVELAPVRVNGLHPGIVGESPAWQGRAPDVLEATRKRTPTGRLATMADVVHAAAFLLDNRSVNGVDLIVDGGRLFG
jgi:NAD(P)-dependent dehydrogenase (short-subunit alcohol dehydrogenase family)